MALEDSPLVDDGAEPFGELAVSNSPSVLVVQCHSGSGVARPGLELGDRRSGFSEQRQAGVSQVVETEGLR